MARHGSFSAAADALGYTQPAISRQIATLEAEVGTMLVRRVPQGAVLTDAGRLLAERGAAVLACLQDTEDELRALAGCRAGRCAWPPSPRPPDPSFPVRWRASATAIPTWS